MKPVPAKELDRLRWQCRRGLLELDIVLLRFLEQGYNDLGQQEKQSFAKLLEEADTNILAYLNQTKKCLDPNLNQILNKLI